MSQIEGTRFSELIALRFRAIVLIVLSRWIQETNDYGLISYGPQVAATATQANVVDGFTRTGTPTPISPDFYNLSNQWKTLTPSSVSEAAYTPSNSAPSCPAYTSGAWEVSGNVALPTIGQTYNAQAANSGSATSGASGTQTGSRSTGTGSGSGSATRSSTGTAASASHTGMASPSRQIAGMSVGLVTVMLGFIWWL